MRHIVTLAAISLLFASCATKQNADTDPNRSSKPTAESSKQALLVGVDDYYPDSLDLPGIGTDINRLKSFLETQGFEVKTLRNAESMKLETVLQTYTQTLQADDSFVFYYSGHGSYTDDTNGDEEDGQDETIVLSDGTQNVDFVDDTLHHYFSAIPAKKLILLDSCHSGTAFKALSQFKSKGIPNPKNMPRPIISKPVPKADDSIGGDYVALTAAQDSEFSLATEDGSLFTSTLLNKLNQPKGIDKSFETLRQTITYEIVTLCEGSSAQPHHPKLTTSSPELKNSTVAGYLGL